MSVTGETRSCVETSSVARPPNLAHDQFDQKSRRGGFSASEYLYDYDIESFFDLHHDFNTFKSHNSSIVSIRKPDSNIWILWHPAGVRILLGIPTGGVAGLNPRLMSGTASRCGRKPPLDAN